MSKASIAGMTDLEAPRDNAVALGIGLVAVGGLAIWAWSRREGDVPPGVAPPLAPPTLPPTTPAPTGPVTPSGRIDGITLSQRADDVVKRPGERIAVSVNWNALTSRAGRVIRWPYHLDVTLLTARGGTVRETKRAFAGESDAGTIDQQATFVMPSGDSKLEIRAALWAAQSDQGGNPLPAILHPFVKIAEATSNRAVPAEPSTGTVVPTGRIDGVTLSQGRGGVDTILRYQISQVPRGSNILGRDFPGASPAGFRQGRRSAEYVPAFRTRFNPGFGQSGEYVPAFRTQFNPGFGQGVLALLGG